MPRLDSHTKSALSGAIGRLLHQDDLRNYLHTLGHEFDELVTTIDYPGQVREIVERADERGWALRLFDVLLALHRGDEQLLRLARQVERLRAMTEDSFENYVRPGDMIDYQIYLRRANAIERVVCSIVVQGPRDEAGTGFLVGPDLLLTNYHVVEDLIKKPTDVRHILFKFDYRDEEDMTLLKYKPGQLRVVAGSPPDTEEREDRPLTEDWDAARLDYALIRLPEELGNKTYGALLRQNHLEQVPRRGWIPLVAPQQALRNGLERYVHIAQHPLGESMKMAQGEIEGIDQNHYRIRYRTNTDKGSSGSPVFNEQMELIAMHHRGNRGGLTNQGIPITAIIADMTANGIPLPQGPPAEEMVRAGWNVQPRQSIRNIIEVMYHKPFIGRDGLKGYFQALEGGQKIPAVLLINGRSRVGRSYLFHFCDRLTSRELFKLVKIDFRRPTRLTPWLLAREIAILVGLPDFHRKDIGDRSEDFKQQIFLNHLQAYLEKTEDRFLFFLDHCDEQDLSMATRDLIVGLANLIARDSVPGYLMAVGLSQIDQDRINGEQPTLNNFRKADLQHYFEQYYDQLSKEFDTVREEDKAVFVNLALRKIPDEWFQDPLKTNVEPLSRTAELITQTLRESAMEQAQESGQENANTLNLSDW